MAQSKQSRMPTWTKSAILATGLAGILYTGHQMTVDRNPTLDRVQTHQVSPESYINKLEKTLPQAIEAKKNGSLVEFLYEPSGQVLETKLRKVLSTKYSDSKELQYMVECGLNAYKEPKQEVASVFPGTLGVFGKQMPLYVIFRERIFSEKYIQNDADIKSVGMHEMRHVDDIYNGIKLAGVTINFDIMSPKSITPDFYADLMELRAHYEELQHIFFDKVFSGKSDVSSEWLTSQGANYAQYWDKLANYPVTDLERKVRDEQFELFKGIKPHISGDDCIVDFNLYGTKNSAVFKKRNPE